MDGLAHRSEIWKYLSGTYDVGSWRLEHDANLIGLKYKYQREMPRGGGCVRASTTVQFQELG